MSNTQSIIGFKKFDLAGGALLCDGKLYEIGKTTPRVKLNYRDGHIFFKEFNNVISFNNMIISRSISDRFWPQEIYAKVEVIGDVLHSGDGLCVTDLLIVRELLNGKYENYEFQNGQIIYFSEGPRKYWLSNGKRHRADDLPAFEWVDGLKEWWVHGKRHRENDLPAVEYVYGTKEWWINGKRHRADGLPAAEYVYGIKSKEWWVDGKQHRDNDLPAIERADGTKEWWCNGVRQESII